MTSLSGCSGGGWTLVMKADGRKVRGPVFYTTLIISIVHVIVVILYL